MKQNTNLDNLHIGNMIKEIAHQKHVPAKEIAALIRRYEKNAGKIYGLDDMDVEDVILISYLLEYNFLKVISEKYLSHLPPVETKSEQENYHLNLDMQIGYGNTGNSDFLREIHIGKHIKKFAEKKGWNQHYVAKLLNCSQTTVSFLYKYRSLKIKEIVRISNTFNHNLIAEVYLSGMFIISHLDMFTCCTTTVSSQQTFIGDRNSEHF
jgi:hypothetical protein